MITLYLAACAPDDHSIACIKQRLGEIESTGTPTPATTGGGGVGGSLGALLMLLLIVAVIVAVVWWRWRVRAQRAAQEREHLQALHQTHYVDSDALLAPPPGWTPQQGGPQQPGTYDVWATPPPSQGDQR